MGKRRQSKINKRNHRQKNRVVNKKSFDIHDVISDEKVTILPDGTWKDKDAPNRGGKVRLEYPDGDSYEGGLNEDLIPHGKGTTTHKDGGKYEGEYANGKRHGENTCENKVKTLVKTR